MGTYKEAKHILSTTPGAQISDQKCLYAPIIPLSVPGPGGWGFQLTSALPSALSAKSNIYGILSLSNLPSGRRFVFTSKIKTTSNNTAIIIIIFLIAYELHWAENLTMNWIFCCWVFQINFSRK